MRKERINVMFDPNDLAAVARIREAYEARTGVPIPWQAVVREILRAGVRALEARS